MSDFFCAFEQQFILIEEAKKHGFQNYIPLSFYKNYSPQAVRTRYEDAEDTPDTKSLYLLKMLISLFTDKGDVVIDPCAGSGSTLLACEELGRKSYGFEIKKEFVKKFNEVLMKNVEKELF